MLRAPVPAAGLAVALCATLAVAAGAAGCPKRSGTPKGPPPPHGVGPDAPPLDLSLETPDRVPALLSAARGRLTVICFFTTGSDDALLFSEVMVALHANWTPYGVHVVGISLDENPEMVPPYIEGARIPYPVYIATKEVRSGRSALGPVWAVPTTLVIDGAGRVRHFHYGLVPLATLEAELDALRREAARR